MVFILVGVLVLIYFSYLLTESFNIDNKVALMNKEYKNLHKFNIDAPSESGREEKFDEIDVEETLFVKLLFVVLLNHIYLEDKF